MMQELLKASMGKLGELHGRDAGSGHFGIYIEC